MLPTVAWKNNSVVMIDQRFLPHREIYVKCRKSEQVAEAIEKMVIRGAPAIGVAAVFGIALAARQVATDNLAEFRRELSRKIARLAATRPTAVNLFWAIERMKKVLCSSHGKTCEIRCALLREALNIEKEDLAACRRLSRLGAKLFRSGQVILTICNTGGLATAGVGTALGVIIEAHKSGKKIKVIAAETRPYLQGSRLTAWELKKAKVPFHLITDNAAGALMSQHRIDAVITGADRVAANGDTANKIGTYTFAVLAKYHRIPLYVALPSSSIDLKLKTGRDIVIEHRAFSEVTHFKGSPVAPAGTKAINPAFDVTPGRLITRIITEKGIFRPEKIARVELT